MAQAAGTACHIRQQLRLLHALLALGLLAVAPVAGAQPAPPEEGGEEVSEEQLEALLESPAAQPDAAAAAATFGPADLAPYFAEGELARAKAEFDRRRYGRARALLEGAGDAPPVRYLRALSALRAGRHALAAEELAALAQDWAPLRDHSLFLAAQAHEKLRHFKQAAELYAQVSEEARAFAEARFALSRLLKRRGDLPGAQAALEPLFDETGSRKATAVRLKALLAFCDLARARGDYNGEHRALLEVWATEPLSREAQTARARLEGLPLPLKWRVRRAEALLSLHLNGEAMDALEQVLPKLTLPEPLACRAHLALGTALRKERQHRKAIAALTPVAEGCQDAELRPRALYMLGYSQSVVAPEDGVLTYAALSRDYPTHGLADDALYFEGRLHLRAGRNEEALLRFEEAARRFPTGNFTAESLFQAYWLHWRKGERNQALDALARGEALAASVADSEAVWRARYWRARLLEEVEPATALALHAEVARQQPGSWYALLARTRLSSLAPDRLALLTAGSPPAQQAPVLEGTREGEVWPLPREALAKDAHFLAGVELLRMGLPDAVGELLEADRRSLSEGGSRLLFQILQRTGYKRAAGVVARTSLQQSVAALPPTQARAIWEASWPRPFRPLIERHSRRATVDPDLLQALIREESRFNPRARSSTGAIGLAQLMPATAREVARALRLPEVTTARLQQPADNIQLGAHYLGGLLRQFDGNLVHAVAGYNAGPAAVARWKRARPEAPLDEWVEHIPFEETRGYVKRVLGSYAAYKLLYAPESPLLLTAARR